MSKFGRRNVIKQGGSYMISLPLQWMKSMDSDVKTVMVEIDSEYTVENTNEYSLRI